MAEWTYRIVAFCVKLYVLFDKDLLVCLPVRCSGKLLVVTCHLDNWYCTLLVRISIVNIIMIDIHANMHDRKQSGGEVRPD
jgi:hypothetical protein